MTRSNLNNLPILLVDDEPTYLDYCIRLLRLEGYQQVSSLGDSRKVLPYLDTHDVCLLIMDLNMPHLRGDSLLAKIAETYPNLAVIMTTGADDVTQAVRCMRLGAADYLVKPLEEEHFLASIVQQLRIYELKRENAILKDCMLHNRLAHPDAFREIITRSERMRSIFKYLESVATTSRHILILGETGVGKELFARVVHKLSDRKRFVPLNVSGLDDQMFSDTLFGHRKGAFTGALQQRQGLIERAGKGSLFLDEIGDLESRSQVKLLRLLQEGEFYALGSDEPGASSARLIAATNRDLNGLMEKGEFRRDLYFRLMSHQVKIPPLRERMEDLPLLLEHFLSRAAREMNKKKPNYPLELLTLLGSYHFPGNVRELEGMVFDAVARHQRGILSTEAFRNAIERTRDYDAGEFVPEFASLLTPNTRFPTIKEATRFLLQEAMSRAEGNQSVAARLLGISRSALNKRLSRAKNAP